MPHTKFIKEYKISETFRNNKIKSMFDYNKTNSQKIFDINIPIENKNWNIGLIVGSSGSGKTTLAKECFNNDFIYFSHNDWDNTKTIVDNFNEKFTAKEITEILSKVGLSCIPDWLKPYNILSNGQKFRVDLARTILENDKPIIFDEFTSVVDRQVAKISSCAISKFIKQKNKQFIAVSCHYDIIDWLQPDWIFDTDKNEFEWRILRHRPEIKIDIRKAKNDEWKLFKNYHYLNNDLNKSAHCYIAEIENKPVAFCAVLHFPHPIVKNIKRIHRIVVLPDYQGIGIGTAFLNAIASIYKEQNYRIILTTSNPSFVFGLQHNSHWIMIRKPSRVFGSLNKTTIKGLKKTISTNRLTATFEYK